MVDRQLPTYAVFDDYHYSQRIAVVARWFLLLAWLGLINYRAELTNTLVTLNLMGIAIAILNGYVHWRILQDRPITKRYVIALSIMDLAIITAAIGVTTRFGNTFFVFYYPALLGLALVFSSRRLSFTVVALVAIVYATISLALEPGVDFDVGEEKTLIIRIVAMFAVVVATNLMTRIERTRRREAVEAERAQAQRNLELQMKAKEAERAAELEVANEKLQLELTERKRAEMALERRTNELAASNQELESFSYSVSHDLRAPLRSIDGFSQALLEDYTDKLEEQGKDYLNRVRSASQRMGELIDDLLDLSRVTRGEMHRETVDVSAMGSAIAAELQQREPRRHVEFDIAEGLVAEADGRLLRAVLENLLGNSWKFTGKKPSGRIEMGTTQHDGASALYVRDDGAGFDMAYADKLFGAFQRLHDATDFQGTGIGLATVQHIINRHGGRIWAEGAVGQGATFYFTLD